ncbi:hypothetical protein D3C81_1949660 [compost metagenome]
MSETELPAEVLSFMKAFKASLLFTKVLILLAQLIGIRIEARGVFAVKCAIGVPIRFINKLLATVSVTF